MGSTKYRARIGKGLGRAFARSRQIAWQLEQTRAVIFSDLHRGQRDHADDFQQCKATYHRALGYYLEAGFSLVVLGDSEELWEGWPAKVVRSYGDSLELEALFHRSNPDRYIKVWGNHDDQWQFPGRVAKHLVPIFGQMNVAESVAVNLMEGDGELGTIFLVHGHQGTRASDRFGKISRFFVRWGWRPIQRLFKIKKTTPARDFELRNKHDRAMYEWAKNEPRLLLIAGHTHNPVFISQTHMATLERSYKILADKPAESLTTEEIEKKACARAELEWVMAQAGGRGVGLDRDVPCYFNTGCCSYSDGDVTGIEIADGEIRLVRWSTDHHDPASRFLEREDLRGIFDSLTS